MKRIIIILLLSVVMVYSCSSTEENKVESKGTQEVKTLFNIPNLLGKSFLEIQKSLGIPTNSFVATEIQKEMGIPNSAEWWIEGVGISLDYTSRKQPIKYIFLMNNNKSEYNVDQLLKIGNLSKESKEYRVIPQRAFREPGFTGLHICVAGYKNEFCK